VKKGPGEFLNFWGGARGGVESLSFEWSVDS